MIIALAGRRIDALDATVPRFPLQNAGAVRERIHACLVNQRATALVCSAACGADLLALDAAGELGIQRRVVLPFEQKRFRETSVVDRPGEWGALFDRILEEVEGVGGLVILGSGAEDEAVFAATNRVILGEALALASRLPPETPPVEHTGEQLSNSVLAVIIWDGKPRGEGDLTVDFAEEARALGLPIFEIATTE